MKSIVASIGSSTIDSRSRARMLLLLFFANLLNVYDRVIPAVLVEPMRKAFDLSDFDIGVAGTAFTVVYALAGLPIGRWADTGSRTRVIGAGLVIWSGFTAISAAAWGYGSFLVARIGVGVGEAACAPTANSLIGDLYPENRRSRAVGIFMLGLPLGTLLGFFTVSSLASWFGSWRAPFLLASIPGLILGGLFMVMADPPRAKPPITQPENKTKALATIKRILTIPTMRWIILSGVGFNFAAYAIGTFLVPLIQRGYKLELNHAAMAAGAIIGVTGLLALTIGGFLADWAKKKASNGRLVLCCVSMMISATLIWMALAYATSVGIFCCLFGLGWLAGYLYIVCVYPSVHELVPPDMRATAMAVFFAAFYLCGAAFGSALVGALSDHLAHAAQVAAGALTLDDQHRAIGLHQAMLIVPGALFVAAFAAWRASRTFSTDVQKMS